MKYGIYYAYWEKQWGGAYVPYIEKAKKLGFDIMELSAGNFFNEDENFFRELRKAADDNGIILTGGYGPRPEHNLSSADPKVVENGFKFYENIFPKMEIAGIGCIGGAIYSYWPVDFTKPLDKKADWERSVNSMKKLADMAADHGITLDMEVLNRFEGYLLNQSYEACEFCKQVAKPNVKVMLDTFHMNIEEDSLVNAIHLAGKQLGHFHVGEANRRPPRPGRMHWEEIGAALRDIGYDGNVVMEPFVMTGGQVGQDIHVWRDLSNGATVEQLDRDAAESVRYLRSVFEGK